MATLPGWCYNTVHRQAMQNLSWTYTLCRKLEAIDKVSGVVCMNCWNGQFVVWGAKIYSVYANRTAIVDKNTCGPYKRHGCVIRAHTKTVIRMHYYTATNGSGHVSLELKCLYVTVYYIISLSFDNQNTPVDIDDFVSDPIFLCYSILNHILVLW